MINGFRCRTDYHANAIHFFEISISFCLLAATGAIVMPC
jgi:hypothetical protein